MKNFLLPLILLAGISSAAQTDSTKNPLIISGYAELYYSYDFNNPSDHNRPGFFYAYNRHNEFNLHLGYIKAAYSTDKTRANLSLMSGTYSNANLSAEPGVLKNVFEANAGVKISKNKNIWVDAGIMPSHIGFESAIGKDCWNLTRSILAENSPYYETGVKLGYTCSNEKLYLAGMLLNGWQHIQRINSNQTISGGTQLTYKPSTKVILNWSTFVGNEQPYTNKLMRYFNNFYGILQLTDKFGVTAGFDYGMQQRIKGGSDHNTWYSPVLIARYAISDKVRTAARGEYYSDEKGVIIATGSQNGFQTMGYSLNLDILPVKNAMIRFEIRSLNSKDKIFVKDDKIVNDNTFATASFAISF